MQTHTLPDGRELLSSGAPWEARMAYSRAVRVDRWILVAGCVGVESDGTYAPGLTRQTARALERIAAALAAFGSQLSDVVRVRIYTTRVADWEQIADAVGPVFGETRPANVLIGIAALVDPRAQIEIEADAWISDGPASRSADIAR